jgi:hypothetical protein
MPLGAVFLKKTALSTIFRDTHIHSDFALAFGPAALPGLSGRFVSSGQKSFHIMYIKRPNELS